MESVVAFTEEEEHRVVTPRSRAARWNRVLEAITSLEREEDEDHALLGNLIYTLFIVENEDFDAVSLIEFFRSGRSIFEGSRNEAAA
jgi:hypothetical protein